MNMKINENWNRNYLELPKISSFFPSGSNFFRTGRNGKEKCLYLSFKGKTVIFLIPKLIKLKKYIENS